MRHTNTNSNTTQQKKVNYEWSESGSAQSGDGQNRSREESGAEGFCFLAKLNQSYKKTGHQTNNSREAQGGSNWRKIGSSMAQWGGSSKT